MQRIKMGDAVVPLSSIDTVYINDTDKRKLCVHTLGDFTISAVFDTEEHCREEFEGVLKIIDEYIPSVMIKVVGNGKSEDDEEGR